MNIVDIISDVEDFKCRYQAAVKNKNKATEFWNFYNQKPIELLNCNQYQFLRERMFKLLRTCKQIDNAAFEKIHKGLQGRTGGDISTPLFNRTQLIRSK